MDEFPVDFNYNIIETHKSFINKQITNFRKKIVDDVYAALNEHKQYVYVNIPDNLYWNDLFLHMIYDLCDRFPNRFEYYSSSNCDYICLESKRRPPRCEKYRIRLT